MRFILLVYFEAHRNLNHREEHPMRYIQPQITRTFDAVSSIKGVKEAPHREGSTMIPSNSGRIPADE